MLQLSMEPAFQQLGLAVLLGLLVGLQRERAAAIAGMRTFPLATVLGTVSALPRPGVRRLDSRRRAVGRGLAPGVRTLVAVLQTPRARPGSRHDHRRGDAGDVRRRRAADGRGDAAAGDCRGRRRGGAPAIQARTARRRPQAGRRRPEGHHAVRADHLHHPAGVAQRHVRPAGRVQPVRDVADGRAHRGHEPGRLHPVQVPRPRRGRAPGRTAGRGHLQHGHHRELRPRRTRRSGGRAERGRRHRHCLDRDVRADSGGRGGRVGRFAVRGQCRAAGGDSHGADALSRPSCCGFASAASRRRFPNRRTPRN